MKTLLVGAGAIGGSMAVLAQKAGYGISILCHSAATKELIEKEGFHLHGVKGELTANFPCFDSVDALQGQTFDVIMIATKYQAMIPVAKSVLPFLSEDGLVVGLQNGILTNSLAEVVGRNHAVGVMIGFGATRNAANDVTMTSDGILVIGMPGGAHPKQLDALCEMFQTVLPTTISNDITREQYSKLIINSCINAVAAITGQVLGKCIEDPRAKRLFLAIAREGMYVARAMGIRVPKYGKLLYYDLLMLMNNRPYNAICQAVVSITVKAKYMDVKPSTLQSLEKGEKTEIDIFNGYFVEKGRQFGVATPVNSLLVEMVHEIEDGKRAITPDNLAAFEALI